MATGESSRYVVLGAMVAMSAPLLLGNAEAARFGHPGSRQTSAQVASSHPASARASVARHGQYLRVRYAAGGLQCVPFARANSGIELVGNAATWWSQAAGVYARGNQPEVGSILSFRATGHMHLGHVAVVTEVVNPRLVEIDHANWATRGSVSRGVEVMDVSPGNDWTEVRVALAGGNGFGDTYPTNGFIYDRPDDGGAVIASDRGGAGAAPPVEEVAELPDPAVRRVARSPRHVRATASEAPRRAHRAQHRRYPHG